MIVRDKILGHKFSKRLGSFAQWYSQSLLLIDFKENHNSYLGLKIRTKKYAKQENSSLVMNSIFSNGKIMVENQTKTQVWKDSSLCTHKNLD